MLNTPMNRPAAMLQLCLLAAVSTGCTNGVAHPLDLEILDTALAAGRGAGGSSAPRAGAGGASGVAGRAGAGGGRSELQAGSGGVGDRPQDPFCEPPTDASSEMELTEALNIAFENKTFCPDRSGSGSGLSRLTSTSDWRCIARSWARTQATREGGGRSNLPPIPPGWTLWDVDGQSYYWARRGTFETSEIKNALLYGDDRRPDHREDLCTAAQLAAAQLPPIPYKYVGVGRYRDATVVFISPTSAPPNPFD